MQLLDEGSLVIHLNNAPSQQYETVMMALLIEITDLHLLLYREPHTTS